MRITSEFINHLEKNEIFVFGSNKLGHHGGGAARFAMEHFGAEWGVGEGPTGQCYALPTMEGDESFKAAVEKFIEYAKQHTELKFMVTPVGCGIAGYKPSEVKFWFKEAWDMKNVWLPERFIPSGE